ncbi:hypothetical protein LTR05_003569 [Lithohypha guttulata]|uniref:Uncharacterized protein n=1 Tax=Lithohypha guttulata TaxID=1690604 RepID=A0AAN7YGV3_9EURO|nr:hypothetical protein LTR05_003569 [Lithohypha guttulata]
MKQAFSSANDSVKQLDQTVKDVVKSPHLRVYDKFSTFTLLLTVNFTHEDFLQTFRARKQTFPELAATAFFCFLQALDYVGSKKHRKQQNLHSKSYLQFMNSTHPVSGDMPSKKRKQSEDAQKLIAQGLTTLPQPGPHAEPSPVTPTPETVKEADPQLFATPSSQKTTSSFFSAVEDISDLRSHTEEDAFSEELDEDTSSNDHAPVKSRASEPNSPRGPVSSPSTSESRFTYLQGPLTQMADRLESQGLQLSVQSLSPVSGSEPSTLRTRSSSSTPALPHDSAMVMSTGINASPTIKSTQSKCDQAFLPYTKPLAAKPATESSVVRKPSPYNQAM